MQTSASTVESPVADIHSLCETMKGAARKAIMAAALANGIKIFTASTQIRR